jgi:hypothetical protein
MDNDNDNDGYSDFLKRFGADNKIIQEVISNEIIDQLPKALSDTVFKIFIYLNIFVGILISIAFISDLIFICKFEGKYTRIVSSPVLIAMVTSVIAQATAAFIILFNYYFKVNSKKTDK